MTRGVLTGAFGATGESAAIKPPKDVPFNVALWGDGVGTVKLQKSFDGEDWIDVAADAAGTPASWDKEETASIVVQAIEAEDDVSYRMACTDYTSGSLAYRISW